MRNIKAYITALAGAAIAGTLALAGPAAAAAPKPIPNNPSHSAAPAPGHQHRPVQPASPTQGQPARRPQEGGAPRPAGQGFGTESARAALRQHEGSSPGRTSH